MSQPVSGQSSYFNIDPNQTSQGPRVSDISFYQVDDNPVIEAQAKRKEIDKACQLKVEKLEIESLKQQIEMYNREFSGSLRKQIELSDAALKEVLKEFKSKHCLCIEADTGLEKAVNALSLATIQNADETDLKKLVEELKRANATHKQALELLIEHKSRLH